MRTPSFTDEQVLSVARRCFLEHGPGVSTTTIAAAAGMSQAALFKRFATKRELLIRALQHDEPRWLKDLDSGPDERPIPEQMCEILISLAEFFAELMPCIAVLSATDIKPGEMFARHVEAPPVRTHRLISEWFARVHKQGRARIVSPAALAAAFIGAVQTRGFMKHVMGDHATELGDDYIERIIDVFWNGMAPEELPRS